MRVLTVRQPWAWALIHGGKTVENRVRYLGDYRGPLAIHGGLAWSEQGASDWEVRRAFTSHRLGDPADDSQVWAAEEPARTDDHFRGCFGAVIGVVNLWAVHQPRPGCCVNRGAPPYGDPWAMDGHWHMCVADARPLSEPIPAKGRLGLWRPDAELQGAIEARLGARTSSDEMEEA